MKIFLHILKTILNEKYPHINFEFYLSRCTNVHMGLNCSILTLHEHDQIISDVEEIWLLKRQDTNFKLYYRSLCILLNGNSIILFLEKILIFEKCLLSNLKNILVMRIVLKDLIPDLRDTIFGQLKLRF